MRKYLVFVAVSVFLLSCADDARDNPNDEHGTKYIGKSSSEGSSSSVEADYPSSSSDVEGPSSSSEEVYSSSEEASSSSEAGSSSSTAPSSSSVELSSSSALLSSSSEAESSSSIAPSSSSVEPSSSSVEPSSSSEAGSSSSEESLTSSSSVEPSSSSAEPSSSSEAPSSSSVEPSSSSSEPSSSSEESPPSSSSAAPCTASDNNSEYYCSGGTMKKYGSVTHGGQEYKTVEIGTQTWMAANLNYITTNNKSKCYGNTDTYCNTYGRLYDWSTAMGFDSSCNSSSCPVQSNHRGICPSGWHIPSDAEWGVLVTFADGSATKLKATSGWDSNGNVYTDDYGFSALPGGAGFSDDSFDGVGNSSFWWNARESGASTAYIRAMANSYSGVVNTNHNSKSNLFSVRCVMN